jgi:predicted O-methyltransferase YrrM
LIAAEWAAVDRYLVDRLVPSDSALDAAAADAAVSAAQGKLLYLLARVVGARRILELGTLFGYSTIWLARALPPEGRLVTLELDPSAAGRARANLTAAGVGEVVDVQVGPALESLPLLDGPFDVVFMDADKSQSPEYLRHVLALSRPGTLIVADNVIRGGAVLDADDPDGRVRGVRSLFDLLAAEPRVSSTAVQTVGAKGWDGFALALVLGESELRYT